MNPVHEGVGVQRGHGRLDLLLGRARGELDADGLQAHLGAVAVLAGDVGVAARVVADDDRPEARAYAAGVQGAHAHGEVLLDVGGHAAAVDPGGEGHEPVSFCSAQLRGCSAWVGGRVSTR
jgi:hypothetical protein